MASEDHARDQALTHRELMIGEFRDARRRRSTASPVQPVFPAAQVVQLPALQELTGTKPAGSSDQRDLLRLDTDKG